MYQYFFSLYIVSRKIIRMYTSIFKHSNCALNMVHMKYYLYVKMCDIKNK